VGHGLAISLSTQEEAVAMLFSLVFVKALLFANATSPDGNKDIWQRNKALNQRQKTIQNISFAVLCTRSTSEQ